MTDEQKYIWNLFVYVYGIEPKKIVPSQISAPSAQTINKYFFVLAYTTGASDYITFSCNGVSTDTRIGTVAGVDSLSYILCDSIITSGAAIVSGYQIIIE